jgi:hypothetical protein
MITDAELESLIVQWGDHIKLINQVNRPNTIGCGDVNLCVERCKELCQFLQTNVPIMREWMMNYLHNNRKSIFVTFWMDHIHKWLKGHLDNFQREVLHPQAEQQWDHVFGTSYRFSLALQRARDLHSIYDIHKCDDVVILDIHKGKEHNGGGFVCDRCDDQEYKWHNELERRMLHSSHPLLSNKMHEYQKNHFLREWKEGDTWEPPHVWGWIGHKQPCGDLDQYKQYMATRYQPHMSDMGKTPIQRLEPLINHIFSHRGLCIPYYYAKTPYECFIQLWNTLDLVIPSIQIYLPMLVELEVDYHCISKPRLMSTQ